MGGEQDVALFGTLGAARERGWESRGVELLTRAIRKEDSSAGEGDSPSLRDPAHARAADAFGEFRAAQAGGGNRLLLDGPGQPPPFLQRTPLDRGLHGHPGPFCHRLRWRDFEVAELTLIMARTFFWRTQRPESGGSRMSGRIHLQMYA